MTRWQKDKPLFQTEQSTLHKGVYEHYHKLFNSSWSSACSTNVYDLSVSTCFKQWSHSHLTPPPPHADRRHSNGTIMEPAPVSQSVRRLCKWKSGARWRWESFYLVDTHYKGEFQTSKMEALRSIMVSRLSARNEIYTFEEHFTRGMG